jgi:hypothetical protein
MARRGKIMGGGSGIPDHCPTCGVVLPDNNYEPHKQCPVRWGEAPVGKTFLPIRKRGTVFLYNADPNCDHEIETLWSGIKCKKCTGWYCE